MHRNCHRLLGLEVKRANILEAARKSLIQDLDDPHQVFGDLNLGHPDVADLDHGAGAAVVERQGGGGQRANNLCLQIQGLQVDLNGKKYKGMRPE